MTTDYVVRWAAYAYLAERITLNGLLVAVAILVIVGAVVIVAMFARAAVGDLWSGRHVRMRPEDDKW